MKAALHPRAALRHIEGAGAHGANKMNADTFNQSDALPATPECCEMEIAELKNDIGIIDEQIRDYEEGNGADDEEWRRKALWARLHKANRVRTIKAHLKSLNRAENKKPATDRRKFALMKVTAEYQAVKDFVRLNFPERVQEMYDDIARARSAVLNAQETE